MQVRAAVVLLLVVLTAGCASRDDQGTVSLEPQLTKAGTLTVCTSVPYEPFEFEEDGQTVGFDIDLVGEVAKRLKLTPAYLNQDFDEIASGELLNKDTCDLAAAGLTITGDRARSVDFSSPYFSAAQALVVPTNSDATSLADLVGKKIAVQKGTTGELYATDNAPPGAEIVKLDDPSQMARSVAAGLLDAAMYDNSVAGGVVKDHPELAVAAEFDTGEQYGMAVKKNGNIELLRTVNDVLAALKQDGGYDAIYAKWFGAAPTP